MPQLPKIDREKPGPLLGLGISYPSVGALERIGSDWDWIWIDAQHGDIDISEAAALIRSAELIDRPALVRIPAIEPAWVGKALDFGAAGVIVPMIESMQEARAMVRAAKFPPLGNRSFGGRRVIDRMGRGFYRTANTDTVLILQVESSNAVALAESFAALNGVDGLFPGPDDHAIRDGRDVDAPKGRDIIGDQTRSVAEACERHGKLSVGLAFTDAALEMSKEYRYRLVACGGDVAFLTSGSKNAAQKARGFFDCELKPR
jgi:4-hydroxy-2-oxoheptanedioate aldolase